jgi:hypothetical protein
MSLPGYYAHASFYKTSRWYFGRGRAQAFAEPQVVAQQDCQSQCYAQYPQCLSGCGCPPGYTNCNGTCVDLNFDASNCGACGNRCNTSKYPGLFCWGGKCQCLYPHNCCATDDAGNCTECLTPPHRCP